MTGIHSTSNQMTTFVRPDRRSPLNRAKNAPRNPVNVVQTPEKQPTFQSVSNRGSVNFNAKQDFVDEWTIDQSLGDSAAVNAISRPFQAIQAISLHDSHTVLALLQA